MSTNHPGSQVETSGGGIPPLSSQTNKTEIELEQIQGNIFGGFNKDHQVSILLEIADFTLVPAALRPEAHGGSALHSVFTHVENSSSKKVLAFNEQFRALRRAGLKPEEIIKATWTNIVFTAKGMAKIKNKDGDSVETGAFPKAFTDGMENRDIGDLGDNAQENWNNGMDVQVEWTKVDAMIIVASDDPSQLDRWNTEGRLAHYLAQIKNTATSGLRVLAIIRGETRMDMGESQVGHEHFGFKDGVSQPGIRGVDAPDDALHNADQGNPGQDLLHPGEFVLGYPRQRPFAKPGKEGPNPEEGAIAGQEDYIGKNIVKLEPPLPLWTRNGSFLVFRRLAQDVKGFRDELLKNSASLGIHADLLGAKMVGRYASGAPLEALKFQTGNGEYQPPMRDPGIANPALANSNTLNNDFEFGDDEDGEIVPIAAHIRKTYPRDQEPEFEEGDGAGNPIPVTGLEEGEAESRTQTHRLLRRGIPFGKSLGAPEGGAEEEPRGLLFLAYQTDIVRQFEFVQKTWVNNPNFPKIGAGQDAIITNNTKNGAISGCPFHALADDSKCPLLTFNHFVKTRGGGYFFSPSLDSLGEWLS